MDEMPKLLVEKLDHQPAHIAVWLRGLWRDAVNSMPREEKIMNIGRLTGIIEHLDTVRQHRADLQESNSNLHFKNGDLREQMRKSGLSPTA